MNSILRTFFPPIRSFLSTFSIVSFCYKKVPYFWINTDKWESSNVPTIIGSKASLLDRKWICLVYALNIVFYLMFLAFFFLFVGSFFVPIQYSYIFKYLVILAFIAFSYTKLFLCSLVDKMGIFPNTVYAKEMLPAVLVSYFDTMTSEELLKHGSLSVDMLLDYNKILDESRNTSELILEQWEDPKFNAKKLLINTVARFKKASATLKDPLSPYLFTYSEISRASDFLNSADIKDVDEKKKKESFACDIFNGLLKYIDLFSQDFSVVEKGLIKETGFFTEYFVKGCVPLLFDMNLCNSFIQDIDEADKNNRVTVEQFNCFDDVCKKRRDCFANLIIKFSDQLKDPLRVRAFLQYFINTDRNHYIFKLIFGFYKNDNPKIKNILSNWNVFGCNNGLFREVCLMFACVDSNDPSSECILEDVAAVLIGVKLN